MRTTDKVLPVLSFLLVLLLTSCGTVPRYRATISRPAGPLPVLPKTELRVLLASGPKALRIRSPHGLLLTHTSTGEVVASLGPGIAPAVEAEAGRLLFHGKRLGPGNLRLTSRRLDEALDFNGRPYRGSFELAASKGGKVLLINRVALEDYLQGVLGSEVPPSWPAEALKAQAVAARSYALFRAGQGDNPAYDLDDTTSSQVYGGIQSEEPRTSAAVRKTRGQVLVWKGKPAQAFFFSNCGGHTADSALVWGLALPYLHGVACPYCAREKHRHWEADISQGEAARRLEAAGFLQPGAALKGIRLRGKDPSGRWAEVELDSDRGAKRVKTTAFRTALGNDLLRSTRFEASLTRGRLLFEGLGWGHGIGLCQEGAKIQAADGRTYKRILEYYYPGTRLVRLN